MKGVQRASVFSEAGNWKLILVAFLMCSLEIILIGVNTLRVATVVWEYFGGTFLVLVGLLASVLSVIVFWSDET